MDNINNAQDHFLTGLRNAHAMEKQALSVMRPQVARLQNYPDVAQMLERHITETEGQLDRIDQLLTRYNQDSSGFKDTVMAATGAMAAMSHTMAEDEVLKNALANYSFENFEAAAYTSLISLARMAGASDAVPILEQNLAEEERMVDWLHRNIGAVTERFVMLDAAGQTAGR